MSPSDDGGYPFAVCLSHDVDRLYKTYQYVWNAVAERDPGELVGLVTPDNPFWTFERTMAIESRLGVRSSFNVLDEIHLSERPKREWLTMTGWKLFAGRYEVDDPAVVAALCALDELGWEIALHGSYTSSEDPDRFAHEKERIEAAVGTEIVGNRQHYWNLSRPDTWRHLQEAGIAYDTSLGSSEDLSYQHGYDLRRPFDDEFVVFPWSLMDGAVMGSAETEAGAWDNCRAVIDEARDNGSVLVLNWHAGDVFSATDYPGWGQTYERAIQYALDGGAWVGPPGAFYDALPHPGGTVADALERLDGRPGGPPSDRSATDPNRPGAVSGHDD